MFYLIFVLVGSLLVALTNFFVSNVYTLRAFGEILLSVIVGVCILFLIDALTAFLIRRMPERWFAPEAKFFSVSPTERKFYRRIKINSWKKYVPEWGCFTGFHKDKVREPNSTAYIGRFLIESNYGVAGHIAGAIAGFAIMFLPFLRPFSVALPLAAINFILGILPTMILRSNTPSLRALYQRNLAKGKILMQQKGSH